jgi:hypothetical protein
MWESDGELVAEVMHARVMRSYTGGLQFPEKEIIFKAAYRLHVQISTERSKVR